MAAAFSISMVLIAYALYGLTPALRDYPITLVDVALAALLALAGGLLTGALGLRLTRAFEPKEGERDLLPQGIRG
jgi:NhaP-type Na+/H+ or K+/H+ antiporter